MSSKQGLMVIMALLAIKFMLVPWFDWAAQQSATMAQKQHSLAKLSQLDEKQLVMAEQLQQLEQWTAAYDKKRLPADEAKITSTLFQFFRETAKIQGLKMTGLRLGELQQTDLTYIPIRFMVDGSANQISQFLNRLQSSPYLMVTAEAILTKLRGRGVDLRANMTIYVVTEDRLNYE